MFYGKNEIMKEQDLAGDFVEDIYTCLNKLHYHETSGIAWDRLPVQQENEFELINISLDCIIWI